MYYYKYLRLGTIEKLERISLPEMAIMYYLKKLNIKFIKSYEIHSVDVYERGKSIDFYLNDYNLAIEYDGRKYHGDPIRDIKKDMRVFYNNINLLRLREDGCCEYYKDDYSINYSTVSNYCSKYILKKFNYKKLNAMYKEKIITNYDLKLIMYLDERRKSNNIVDYIAIDLKKLDLLIESWRSEVNKHEFDYLIIQNDSKYNKVDNAVKNLINYLNNKYSLEIDLSTIDSKRDYDYIINQENIVNK